VKDVARIVIVYNATHQQPRASGRSFDGSGQRPHQADGPYNFKQSVWPVPLEVHIQVLLPAHGHHEQALLPGDPDPLQP